VVGRGELTDRAWAQLAPLLPRNQRRGGRWRDHRTVINGILWKLRTGAPWRDLPNRYGPGRPAMTGLVRWRRDGTWDRLSAHAQTASDAVGELEWVVSVDTTSVRAHQLVDDAAEEAETSIRKLMSLRRASATGLPFSRASSPPSRRHMPRARLPLKEEVRPLGSCASAPVGLKRAMSRLEGGVHLQGAPALDDGDHLARRGAGGVGVGASANVVSHCCMSARSGSVSGVSWAASLLLSVAAAVASVGPTL
jgi:transposase